MKFTKMQGAGNDYVYVNGFVEMLPENPNQLAKQIADRHFGVGGDGLVLILPSDVADARMRMFNPDGSESEMCGNAIRCVAKYIYDHGICRNRSLRVETLAGIKQLDCEVVDSAVSRVRVDMGIPILRPGDIPTTLRSIADPAGDLPLLDHPIRFHGHELLVSTVSMGNPHCVIFTEQLSDDLVLGLGPKLERSEFFPHRTNVEFVQIETLHRLHVRVWERGTGETLACGTGACAVVAAGVLTRRCDRQVAVVLPGGELEIEWAENNHLFMTGPAVQVFSGEWGG